MLVQTTFNYLKISSEVVQNSSNRSNIIVEVNRGMDYSLEHHVKELARSGDPHVGVEKQDETDHNRSQRSNPKNPNTIKPV